MAVSIVSLPDTVAFAGNPVLVTVRTSLSDLTFLTIRLTLTARLDKGSSAIAEGSFELSIPTSGDEDVTFDLSSALESMFRRVEVEPCFANGMTKSTQGIVAYRLSVYDEYLDDDNTIVSTKDTANDATNGYRFVVAGELSDMQRYMWAKEGKSLFEHNMVLSSKPDGEMIPVNFPLLLPVLPYIPMQNSTTSFKIAVQENGASQSISFVSSTRESEWLPVSFSKVGAATVSVPNAGDVSVFVVGKQASATYFEFVNRYGCLESVVCYGRKALANSFEAERLTRVAGRSFAPTSSYIKRLSSVEQTYTLSTGPISEDWARWFVSDFFQSNRVWMYDEQTERMIPVVIETSDDATVYSQIEKGVIDISFTAVCAFEGFRTGSHI